MSIGSPSKRMIFLPHTAQSTGLANAGCSQGRMAYYKIPKPWCMHVNLKLKRLFDVSGGETKRPNVLWSKAEWGTCYEIFILRPGWWTAISDCFNHHPDHPGYSPPLTNPPLPTPQVTKSRNFRPWVASSVIGWFGRQMTRNEINRWSGAIAQQIEETSLAMSVLLHVHHH